LAILDQVEIYLPCVVRIIKVGENKIFERILWLKINAVELIQMISMIVYAV
jgi:hypothetical protein